jgi:hypothetical protein
MMKAAVNLGVGIGSAPGLAVLLSQYDQNFPEFTF